MPDSRFYERRKDDLVYKSKQDSKTLGTQLVDVSLIIDELINWRREAERGMDTEKGCWTDPVRLAMIDSFEDIVLNAIMEA